VDNMTTSPDRTVDTGRWQLAQQLASAWSATCPWAEPPADWLNAAVTALTAATTAVSGPDAGELDRIDAADLARWQDIAGQLRQLRSETRYHARAVAGRRVQLSQLQAQVRERAIDQLDESPHLEDALRDALAAWGLPPIDTDSDDEDSGT
jgi:hypothetical protein